MATEPPSEEKQPENKQAPPYVPYQTFEAFLERLKGTVTPTRIDSSVLRHLSGSTQTQLLSALKFLGLIKTDGAVNESLRRMVIAYKTQKWKEELTALIAAPYRPIIGDLDIATATSAQLKERFREAGGVEGDTVEKCIRFYLMVLKEAGVQFSPLLKIRQRIARGTGSKRANKQRSAAPSAVSENGDEDFQAPEGTFKIPLDILGIAAVLYLPTEITQKRWDAISQYVKTLIGLRATAMGADEDEGN